MKNSKINALWLANSYTSFAVILLMVFFSACSPEPIDNYESINVSFQLSANSIAPGEKITVTNTTTGDAGSYEWVFGSGVPAVSNAKNPGEITYSSAGTFTIKLTAKSSREQVSAEKTIIVTNDLLAPVAEFSASQVTISEGESINFTDQSILAPTSWAWTFEGGTPATSTTQNPTGISYTSAGSFDVTLVATNPAGSNTKVKANYIVVAPYCSPVTDVEGNTYQVVSVGGKCWMTSNLKTTRYSNYADILFEFTNSGWLGNTSGAYTYYNNSMSNDNTYGKLYNWYAVNNSYNICPTGWHPATRAEWQALVASQGGESLAGGALRSVSGWDAPNTGATNSSGFSALPGGFLNDTYTYYALGSQAYFWTNTATGSNLASYYLLHNGSADLFNYDIPKSSGMSCRCVKD